MQAILMGILAHTCVLGRSCFSNSSFNSYSCCISECFSNNACGICFKNTWYCVVVGVTVRGNHYGLFGSKGSQWSGLEEKKFTNSDSKGYFSVALLPDKEPVTLERFSKYAHNHVVDTRVSSRASGGYLESVYDFTTEALEGVGKGTLYSLYPHQWKYSIKCRRQCCPFAVVCSR